MAPEDQAISGCRVISRKSPVAFEVNKKGWRRDDTILVLHRYVVAGAVKRGEREEADGVATVRKNRPSHALGELVDYTLRDWYPFS
jgi:hypothetical protein